MNLTRNRKLRGIGCFLLGMATNYDMGLITDSVAIEWQAGEQDLPDPANFSDTKKEEVVSEQSHQSSHADDSSLSTSFFQKKKERNDY